MTIIRIIPIKVQYLLMFFQEKLFDEKHFDANNPVFEGADVSKGQLLAMLMGLCLRHGLSGVAMKDLLDLFNTVIPGCVPSSKWYLDKAFFNLSDKVELHFYCTDCVGYIGKGPDYHCETCLKHWHKEELLKSASYFLVMPLADQLKNILPQSALRGHFRHDESVGDINTGKLYQDQGDFIDNPDNVTISFNCDGVPVFKSSQYSLWPILCTINELSLDERGKSIMLHSLWFGRHKPRVDTYFAPFIAELQSLHENGVAWIDSTGLQRNSRVHALVCVCDAVARAMIQNFKQFNGKYGCGFCCHEGEVVDKGKGHTRVYPVQADIVPLRSMASTVELAERATESGEAQMGVKGASPLFLLPSFDFVKGFVPDYMHSVCLGVVRQFTNLWLDGKYSAEEYHLLPDQMRQIDSALCEIKPPSEVRRNPRPLSERAFWKATEWRAFLLLYSPVVMKDFLPRRFYKHWMLLAFALHILLSSVTTQDQVNCAELCLVQFVAQIPQLYGIEHCSYNSHLLVHLAQSVRDWGSLWANSAFVYEDANGKLLDLFNGTQAVPCQIFKYFFAQQRLIRSGTAVFEDAPRPVRELFCRLTGLDYLTKAGTVIARHIVMLGKCNYRQLSACERVALENRFPLNDYLHNIPCRIFKRCVVWKMLLTTQGYAAGYKRNNSVIATEGTYGLIASFVVLSKVCQCKQDCSCSELLIYYYELSPTQNQFVVYDGDINVNVSKFLVQVENTGRLMVCTSREVKAKCTLVEHANRVHVVKMPAFERD